jgi:hypothetical protein
MTDEKSNFWNNNWLINTFFDSIFGQAIVIAVDIVVWGKSHRGGLRPTNVVLV